MAPSFLDLPVEIREQIYSEILSSATSILPPIAQDEPARYEFKLDILRTNRRIHHEAKKIFQHNIFVKITAPWPESIDHIRSEGKVPTVTTGDKAETFRGFHLWVFIDTPADPLQNAKTPCSMLICVEDLEAFIKMWHFSNLNHMGLNAHLRLKLTIQDPHVPDRKIPKALQTRLLLPFGSIKDLHTFSIHGSMLLPSVEQAVNETRAIPDPTVEECIQSALNLKEAGNDSIKAGSHQLALQQYISAFAAIHIQVTGRQRIVHAEGYYIRNLRYGPFQGQRGNYVRMILRVQLVANIVLAYLKMREWSEALFWGKRSILLFKLSVTGDGIGELGDVDVERWLGQTAPVGLLAQHAMGSIFYRTVSLVFFTQLHISNHRIHPCPKPHHDFPFQRVVQANSHPSPGPRIPRTRKNRRREKTNESRSHIPTS